jgi:glycine/D-amino acid oxidase-like deaminating enzyme
MAEQERRFDVAVIGGGIMGSSVAYFLKQLDPAVSVCVIEPDPTYEFASTPRAMGGARRLFSCPENILMSDFGIDFIKKFPEQMRVNDDPAYVDWHERGYLFIADPEIMTILEENARVQESFGVEIKLLDRKGLLDHFPSMFVDDLAGAAYSPRDGWCDPWSFLQGFRKKAILLGAEYIRAKVTGLEHDKVAVTMARLEPSGTVKASAFVNATGAWAATICDMVGIKSPVQPLRRFEHFFTAWREIEPLPMVKDVAKLAFRPEGQGYSGGVVNPNEPRGFNFEIDGMYFEEVVWPALAHRFPAAFEGAKCHHTKAGLYEQCELDGNPIIGNWKGHLDNFYNINGFSGHGMQHGPAAGRAVAELIIKGSFQTVDLTRLGYERVVKQEPYPERGVV